MSVRCVGARLVWWALLMHACPGLVLVSSPGRRRIDVRTFVTSLMERQHVLETRLQLAEESHTVRWCTTRQLLGLLHNSHMCARV